MRFRSALCSPAQLWGLGSFARAAALQAIRRAEYEDFPLPPDWNQTTEWTRARLHYPSVYASAGYYRRGGDLNWTIDYPRSDRHLLEGVRRLTRIDTRSVEQVVDLDGTDDVITGR